MRKLSLFFVFVFLVPFFALVAPATAQEKEEDYFNFQIPDKTEEVFRAICPRAFSGIVGDLFVFIWGEGNFLILSLHWDENGDAWASGEEFSFLLDWAMTLQDRECNLPAEPNEIIEFGIDLDADDNENPWVELHPLFDDGYDLRAHEQVFIMEYLSEDAWLFIEKSGTCVLLLTGEGVNESGCPAGSPIQALISGGVGDSPYTYRIRRSRN